MTKLLLACLTAGAALVPVSAADWGVFARLPTCGTVMGAFGHWHLVCG